MLDTWGMLAILPKNQTKPSPHHWSFVPGSFIYSALLKINFTCPHMSSSKKPQLTVYHLCHPNQHIQQCHEGTVRICNVRTGSHIKTIPTSWRIVVCLTAPSSPSSSVLPPSIPLQHPRVAFVCSCTPPLSSHTLSLWWTILFPSSKPYNRPVKATQYGLLVPSPQAFSACRPALFKKDSALTSHKKGKS